MDLVQYECHLVGSSLYEIDALLLTSCQSGSIIAVTVLYDVDEIMNAKS